MRDVRNLLFKLLLLLFCIQARRVVAMAASHDLYVIPHGSSIYSYHLQYAFRNCPVAEFINLSPKADKIVPYFGGLFPDEPLPKDGYIELPDRLRYSYYNYMII